VVSEERGKTKKKKANKVLRDLVAASDGDARVDDCIVLHVGHGL
jgi:hypothetical protein